MKKAVRSPAEILQELDAFKAWSRSGPPGSQISPIDFIGFIATPDLFFGFVGLFCPEVVQRRGGVFLASGFTDEALDAWLRKGTTLREAQRVMNHIHVSTLIQDQVVSDELAIEIADHLASIWNLTLGGHSVVAERIGTGAVDAATTFYVADSGEQ